MTYIIELMYKEYGVEKKYLCNVCVYSCPYVNANDCEYSKMYPPFTAEKQIELIKLIQSTEDIDCLYSYNRYLSPSQWQVVMEVEFITEFANERPLKVRRIDETWEGALAKLIIKLKPHINNSKVKEILEK